MHSPLAHALTRCLGPLDSADPPGSSPPSTRPFVDVTPDVRTRDLPGPGWLLLCSDGLWNYVPSAADLASLVRAAGPDPAPARIARRLVTHALARGGQDNTTVLLYEHR